MVVTGGEKKNFGKNHSKRLLWVGSTLESHGFVLDMVVNGDRKNFKKIIGKNYLWVGPIQESQSFVLDMVVGKKLQENLWKKLLWGGSA